MIAHNPLHGSGQAGFPHPALALGDNAHAAQGIGMTDGRQRQPASDEAPHAIPEDASVLATPRQRAMPEPSHLESKESQRRVVHGHSVIPEVSTHHRLQPFALFGNGFVHPSSKLGFTSFNFVCNLLRIVCRSTVYIPLLLFFTQICVKPRKLNVSGFPSPRRCRLLIANGPNSSSRVFSGCNSRWNFLILSVSSARNCSASALLWNPTTISSANRTTITSPCARF